MVKSKDNLPRGGVVRILGFKEKNMWHFVAIEFNIVIVNEDYQIAFLKLLASLKAYIKGALKSKAEKAFQQDTNPKYEKMWGKSANYLASEANPYKISSRPRRQTSASMVSTADLVAIR